jgi:hypothetical protein
MQRFIAFNEKARAKLHDSPDPGITAWQCAMVKLW